MVETIHPQNGVGHREPTRGEDNVVVLKDVNVMITAFHIFGCCSFSDYPSEYKTSQYFDLITAILQRGLS